MVSYGFGACAGRRARGTRGHLAGARHPGSRPALDRPSSGARPRARRSATLERVQKLDVRVCGAREPVGGSRGGRTNGRSGRSGLVFSQGPSRPSRQFSGAIHGDVMNVMDAMDLEGLGTHPEQGIGDDRTDRVPSGMLASQEPWDGA